MVEEPLLSIVGIGEDGVAGLSPGARAALAAAEIVVGGPRHLALAGAGSRGCAWPTPFSLAPLVEASGRRVVALVSGDPFWHGAGRAIADAFPRAHWVAYPGVSSFQLAAARLGWALETTICLGLHATPFARARRELARGARLIALLRDGAAAGALAAWLTTIGFGASRLTLLERLGGPGERIRSAPARDLAFADVAAPVAVAIEAEGEGLARTPGLPDEAYLHDGQITKWPVRAATLAALGPRRGEFLWDVGAGSGSIAVEWSLAGGRAVAIEARADRIANIEANFAAFGVAGEATALAGRAPDAFDGLAQPDAVFVGGGADEAVLAAIWRRLPQNGRLVVNSVTLETDALVAASAARRGGTLLRLSLETAETLGRYRGWKPARPVTQWRVVKEQS